MQIAVASGKGGTGKTGIAVSMALSAGKDVNLFDCDVEEPNCDILLKTKTFYKQDVNLKIPVIDDKLCTGCGNCVKLCQFNSIIIINKKAEIHEELCHSCGGCSLACNSGAVSEKKIKTGAVTYSKQKGLYLISGALDIGKITATAVIRSIKEKINTSKINIIDCPPGTSCSMITAINGCDYIILVTEPTPFGLNDLKLAVQTVKELSIPFGVIINRADGDKCINDYCSRENIEILLEIESSRKIAEYYSVGKPVIEAMPDLRSRFKEITDKIHVKLLADR